MALGAHPGMGHEIDVVAQFRAQRLVDGRIVIGVATQHRRVVADFAQGPDHHRDIDTVGRNKDHVRLLVQRLQARELGREIVVPVGVAVFQKDLAADRLEVLDEVLRQRLGVGDELVGHHVGRLPAALLEGVVRRHRAHGGVPHGKRELLVAERPGAVERVGGAGRDADDTRRLRLAAGRAAEIEITGRDDQFRSHVDQLDRHVADRDRIGLAVDIDESDLLAEQSAGVVQGFYGDLGALEARGVQRRLHTGQAQRAADQNLVAGRVRRARQQQRREAGIGQHGFP